MEHKPIVLINGRLHQLPAGDELDIGYMEFLVAVDSGTPEFIFTDEGDTVMSYVA